MELPLAYRALCNLFDFASLSELQSNNKNSSSFEPNEFNPLFEDALIEEVDRLSRKFGHRFFFRLFTALTQRSNKFPLFLASHPNHGDLFLSIMATFAGEDEEESGNEYGDEEKLLRSASFIWIWKSLGCCTQFVGLFGVRLAQLILMSYHSDPSSEFFFQSLSVVINIEFADMNSNQSAIELFFNALHLDMMEKSPLFDMFINSLPSEFHYLKPNNIFNSTESLEVDSDMPFPIDQCTLELTGKSFSPEFQSY